MSVPSALTLIVRVFPDPAQQARAIGIFGGCGAVADGTARPLLASTILILLALKSLASSLVRCLSNG